MKSLFSLIPFFRDVYFNWEALLKTTSYRCSYDIGAIGTSHIRVFEYHVCHWLRQSDLFCFKNWSWIFDLTKNGYLRQKFSKLSSECVKNDCRPGENIFLKFSITINGSYVASRTVLEHYGYSWQASIKILCSKWPICKLKLSCEILVIHQWPRKNFSFHFWCKLLSVWQRVGSDRNHGQQGFFFKANKSFFLRCFWHILTDSSE